MSQPLRVLFLVHGHPAERPGGAEVYAWELFLAMKDNPRFEPFFLSRTDVRPGQPVLSENPHHPGHFRLATDMADFDFLYQELRAPANTGWWLETLLRKLQPDVVHFQHTLFLGLRLIPLVRTVLPRAKVIYTLHEFFPLCHHRGLLYRTREPGPCDGPSPSDCHRCFPDISPASFAGREKHVLERLAAVDRFIAPSKFLGARFAAWGLPTKKIVVEEYGRRNIPVVPPRPAERRDQFGYFGQINPFKGVDVLLQAVLRLATVGSPTLRVHLSGANLELQPPAWQEAYRKLLDAARATGRVIDHGPYAQAELPRRMALVDWVVVPSIWWENSPLVIQEAAASGRPVLTSDIGGMAEKVVHGVTGYHFRAGDPLSLAAAIRDALLDPDAWTRLRESIPPPYAMSNHLRVLEDLYNSVKR